MPLLYRTLYPFDGDVRQGQLAFPAGVVLAVCRKHDHSHNNGWMHGRVQGTTSGGWFPATYVQEIDYFNPSQECPNKETAIASTTAGYNGGFEGPVMGCTPAPNSMKIPSSLCPVKKKGTAVGRIGLFLRNTTKKIGKSGKKMKTAFQNMTRNHSKKEKQSNKQSVENTNPVPRESTVPSKRVKKDGWFVKGIKNSSLGSSRSKTTASSTTTTTTTCRRTPRNCFSPKETTTVNTSVTTAAHARKNVAGTVGTLATYRTAMNLAYGNVGGALRTGFVAAAAFAVEGNQQ